MLANITKNSMREVTGAEARNRLFKALTEAAHFGLRTEVPEHIAPGRGGHHPRLRA